MPSILYKLLHKNCVVLAAEGTGQVAALSACDSGKLETVLLSYISFINQSRYRLHNITSTEPMMLLYPMILFNSSPGSEALEGSSYLVL